MILKLLKSKNSKYIQDNDFGQNLKDYIEKAHLSFFFFKYFGLSCIWKLIYIILHKININIKLSYLLSEYMGDIYHDF